MFSVVIRIHVIRLQCYAIEVALSQPIIIICLYRPPNNSTKSLRNILRTLNSLLHHLTKIYSKHCQFLADAFKFDLHKDNNFILRFRSLMESYNLTASISLASRLTKYSNALITFK